VEKDDEPPKTNGAEHAKRPTATSSKTNGKSAVEPKDEETSKTNGTDHAKGSNVKNLSWTTLAPQSLKGKRYPRPMAWRMPSNQPPMIPQRATLSL